MRYYRIRWTDTDGAEQYSIPLMKWTEAHAYYLEIGGDAEIIRY